MQAKVAFEKIAAQADGPIKKFQLIKVFGNVLRASVAGDIRALSCAEIEAVIRKALA